MSAAMQPSMWCPGINLSHPLANGLVGAWPMWEGDGDKVMDYSGNGNHGTLTFMDPETDWVATEKGLAVELDGSNDHVSVPSITFGRTYPFTISAWYRPASSTQAKCIVSISDNTASDKQHAILHCVDGGAAGNKLSVMSRNTGWEDATSTTAVVAGEWVHVVGVWRSATVREVWFNGVLEDTNTGSATATSGANVLEIGRLGDATPNWQIAGSVGGVSVWGRGLSAGEIQQLYADPYALYRKHGGLM